MVAVKTDISSLLLGPDRTDPTRAGGKAAVLARLAGIFDVPPFLVIPADAFNDSGLEPALRARLETELESLGPGPFAVRSSGLEEDGSESAHAGQFQTELGVNLDGVAAAAQRVWQSGFSASLAQYRRSRGLDGSPQPPAVIVQQMVDARVAGVAFSADPVSGDTDTVVISAVDGLADRLVAGEIDGDQYWIGQTTETRAPLIAGERPVLQASERDMVATLARRAAEFFGRPQDIEWAFDAERLYLLQSRPITTVAPVADDDAVTIWDNSNIVESYPGVVAPLTFTFARYIYAHVYAAFSRLMGVPRAVVDDHRAVFENMLGRIEGRVYYNLLNWYRALALFPGFKSNRAYMEGMMGAAPLPEALAERIAPASTSATARLLDRIRLMRTGLGLGWHQLRLARTIARFYARLAQALATPNATIDTMPTTRLAAEYRELERQLLARWDAPLINDFLCMIAFGASRKALQRWAGQRGLALHADMLIGQGDIVSAEPARLIRAMGQALAGEQHLITRLAAADRSAIDDVPALRTLFDRYIEKFGDRCTQELKLESVTLHDDPTPLLRAIAAAAVSPPKRVVDVEETADKAFAEAFAGRPLRHWIARRLIDWARARVRDRENLRFERTRVFGRVRRIMLALGQRFADAGLLAEPREIFYLTLDEVLGAVEGAVATEDLAGLAAMRRAESQAFVARPDPPERLTVYGAHALGLQSAAAGIDAHSDDGDTRTGLACCKGVVTARVRVIRDPRTETLQAGEILVARHTDPGWIAVFAAAAGVIAERGSLLSHSAIVAREMGVPCVVALPGVTGWLRTGDKVRLDGGSGVVRLLERGDDDDD